MFPAIRQYIDPSNLLIERAVAEWANNNNEDCFLGADADDSFNMNTGLEPFTDNLLLWFQLVVSVKKHRAARARPRSLYVIVQADMLDYEEAQCMSLQPVSGSSEATPPAVSRAALGNPKDFFRLNLRLKTTPQVVMPKADPPLLPATEKSRSLLTLLQSFSQARNVTIYLPLGTAHAEALQRICKSVVARKLTNHRIDFESVYKDGAERDAWSNFHLFSPPTTQAQPAPPGLPTSDVTEPSTCAAPPQDPTATPLTGSKSNSPPPTYEEEAQEANVGAEPQENTTPPAVAPVGGKERVDDAETLTNSGADGGVPMEAGTTTARGNKSTDQIRALLSRSTTKAETHAEPDDPDGETTTDDEAPPPANHLKRKASPTSPTTAAPSPSQSPAPPASHRPRRRRRVRFASPSPQPTTSPAPAPAPAPLLPRGTNRTRSSSRNSTPDSLRAALAQFLLFLANVDVELEHRYAEALWELGACARAGDGVGFYEVQARCKAEVLVRYRRRRVDEV